MKTGIGVSSTSSRLSYKRNRPRFHLSRSSTVFLGLVGLLVVVTVLNLCGVPPVDLPDTLTRTLSEYKHKKHKHPTHKNPELDRLRQLCAAARAPAGPPADYNPRNRLNNGSERFVPGTKAVLIKNAKIWTGANDGTEVVYGDLLLDKGVVVAVGSIPGDTMDTYRDNLEPMDAHGRWITPGLVDLHSHIGVGSLPALSGSRDSNSRKAPILPWLRSVDGLNTHDDSYGLTISGGVTTVQVLPGSANNIGGQSFLIKLRETEERSVMSRLLEPPFSLLSSELLNSTGVLNLGYSPWRHMKHACGENPSRLYSASRMDSAWNFRQAYNEARKVKQAQDAYCDRVESDKHIPKDPFPESYEWESLVDVLRGRVKLSVHCYEAVDLDGIVRLSNEFQFPVASFHHAGETYLVPDLLKKTWGGTPATALFASNARKKREAYRASEFAPRVLAEHGIPVVMKSDHPVLNSRYLLYEAQVAHYYGLSPALALSSVTTTPAKVAGVGHRVGQLKPGYDADAVIWDSHPLALGATPIQVFIDGIKQFVGPSVLEKGSKFQIAPETPDWEREKNETIKWEGLPPLTGKKMPLTRPHAEDMDPLRPDATRVRFVNVTAVYIPQDGSIEPLFEVVANVHAFPSGVDVFITDGRVSCISSGALPCPESFEDVEEIVIDLAGGSLGPGLTSFGSLLGLSEIKLEPSTTDGVVIDPLQKNMPVILGTDEDSSVVRAADALQFGGRNSLLAYRAGVTKAVVSPDSGDGFLRGLSAAFDLGAEHALEDGAILEEEAALHVRLDLGMQSSVSTQIKALRNFLHLDNDEKLIYKGQTETTSGAWARVRRGELPLVLHVESADIMATLISLKKQYEAQAKLTLRMTFAGASEAHILAKEIANAGVSVIITSPRPLPATWSQQRILPGPPLSPKSSVKVLLDEKVNVAVGTIDDYNARNLRFDLGWLALEANGTLSRAQTIALATTNLDRALGLDSPKLRLRTPPDIVAYKGGGILDMNSKVVGVLSPRKKTVVLF